jgi:hypothetical protein
MRHRNTELLLGYWMKLRGARRVPARAEIDPRAIKRLLPDLFILDRTSRNQYPFRLAGTRICWLYGKELRETNFLSLWRGSSERQARETLEQSLRTACPSTLYVIGETLDHRTLRAEIMFLPIADSRGNVTRLLGAYTPLDPVMTLGERKLVNQWIVSSDFVTEGAQVETADAGPGGRDGDQDGGNRATVPYLRLVVSRDDSHARSPLTDLLEHIADALGRLPKPAY